MRILHVTDHYLPSLGGIETHVAGLARRQAARGDDVTVLTSTAAARDAAEADLPTGGVRVHRVPATEGVLPVSDRYDVVHGHLSVVAPFTSPVVARAARAGLPTLVTVHSLWGGTGPLATVHAALTGLRTAPVGWTAVSHAAADQLRCRLPSGTPVDLLPNAVDAEARAVTPSSTRSPVRLVSTMRIARRKRPLELLRAFVDLHRSCSVATELVVIGDGPMHARMIRSAERHGIADAVTVTGRLDPDDVLRTLATADVYVAPARLESFGLAALEARRVGLPVVGYSGTGLAEFISDGVEGFLCADDSELRRRLWQLVVSADLRIGMAEHNRTVPSTLTWDRALQAHDGAYDSVLQGRSTTSARRPPYGWALR